MTDILITGILSVWLLVTVICQFQSRFKRILRWPDFLLFVMSTRLFANMPANVQILYRDRPPLGEPGPWHPVEWEAGKSWGSLFWAPRFWRDLHLLGVVNRVLWMQKRLGRERQTSNMWYRLVVDHVKALPRADERGARQFRIVRTYGHLVDEDATVLFTSEFHRW